MANFNDVNFTSNETANPDLQNLRLGLTAKDVYSTMSDIQAITEAFGGISINASGLDMFAVSMYARCALRQKHQLFDHPSLKTIVSQKEVVVYHQAINLLRMKVRVISPTECDDYDMIKALADMGQVDFSACKFLASACLDSERNVVVVPESWRNTMDGSSNKDNVIFLPDSWGNVSDFHATLYDAAYAARSYAIAVNQHSVQFKKIEDAFYLTIDTVNIIRFDSTGVWDDTRNRRFGCLGLDHSANNGNQTIRTEDQLTRVNSYGCFIYALLYLGAEHHSSPSALYRAITKGTYAPMSSISELCSKNIPEYRAGQDHYSTSMKAACSDTPFTIRKGQTSFLAKANKEVQISLVKIPNKLTTVAMLGKYNLADMPGGQFVDGRTVVLRFKDIAEEARNGFFLTMFAESNIDALTWIVETFNFPFSDEATALKWLGLNSGLILSNKLAKAVKRTQMGFAMSGKPTNSENSRFCYYCNQSFGEATNVIPIASVVSISLIAGAGMAAFWGNKELLNTPVLHTQSGTLGTEFSGTIEDIKLTRNGYTKTTEEKWTTFAYDTEKPCPAGTSVAEVPFETKTGTGFTSIVSTQKDGQLVSVSFAVTSGVGNTKVIAYKIVTMTVATEIKVRSNSTKAILSFGPTDIIHNGLNKGVVADALFPSDTQKFKDLLLGMLDIIALTLIKNNDAEGIELIRQLNLLVGYKGTDKLVFSPLVSMVNGYKALTEYFESKFAREIWSKTRDNGEMTDVLMTAYSSWTAVQLGGIFPAGATECVLLSEDKTAFEYEVTHPDAPKRSNLLGFYTLNGVKFILQRGWSYAGTTETGPVYVPAQVEMSEVAAIVGETPLMAGTARKIAEDSPECGKQLIQGGYRKVHLLGAFKQMLNYQAVGYRASLTALIPLADVPNYLSEELKIDIADPTQPDILARLAKELEGFSIQCSGNGFEYTLYIPAIWSQDSNFGVDQKGNLSSLVEVMLSCVVQGATSVSVNNYLKRIYGAMKVVAEGKGLARSAAYGATGVQAKGSSPLIGIPVGETWVKQSSNQRSVYQTMVRRFGKLENLMVAFSRSPMVQPYYCNVVVITPDHWAFDYLGEYVHNLSPLAMILNGGDFDGDNVACYRVFGVEATTLQNLIDFRMLVSGNADFADFEILSPKQQDKKSGKSFDSILSHVAVLEASQGAGAAWEQDRSFPALLAASAECLQEIVGWIHMLALTVDTAIALMKQTGNYGSNSWAKKAGLDSVFYEMYEIPLGGFDKAAYAMFKEFIIPCIQEGTKINVKALRVAMKKAGLNSEFAFEVAQACFYVYECREMMKTEVSNSAQALKAINQISVLISKGRASSDKAAPLISSLMNWAIENKSDWTQFVADSIVVASVTEWLRVVNGTTAGYHLVNVSYFHQ